MVDGLHSEVAKVVSTFEELELPSEDNWFEAVLSGPDAIERLGGC